MNAWVLALLLIGFVWIALWYSRLRPLWFPITGNGNESAPPPGTMSIIIPARNEANRLPTLLSALAAEARPGMEIIVADDASTDGTAAAVSAAQARDPRLRLVICPEKPAGWAGKTWAITQGIAGISSEWLFFCDADLVPDPGSLDLAFTIIREQQLDALSLIPRMTNHRLAPSLLLACFAVGRALQFRPAVPGRRHGLVQGAFLAVRRSAYEAVGGHQRIKGSLLEDIELGYLLQDAGFRVLTRQAHHIMRTETYPTWAEAREGMRRHIFASLAWSVPRLVAAVATHGILFVFPVVCLLRAIPASGTSAGAPAAALFAVVAMYAANLPLVRQERLPLAAGLLIPVSLLAFGELLLESAWGYRRGDIAWKGRSYHATSSPRETGA